MFNYIGTCIDIDYEGENFGFDPTDLAQAEELAFEENLFLKVDEFWELINYIPQELKELLLKSKDVEYGYNEYLKLLWAYEPQADIHYLFM